MIARKLHLVTRSWEPFRREPVADCPQPETSVKPVEYGAAPWGKLPPTPTADQLTIRCRAQSLLSKGGKRAELPSYEEAQRIIARANKPRIRIPVTVPEPCASLPRTLAPPASDSLSARPALVQASGHSLPASPDACSRVRSGGAGRQSIPDESQLPCDPVEWAAQHGGKEAQALLAAPAPAFEWEPF